MVTLPESAADDEAFVGALVGKGMSCARINCAHGTHAEWIAMVRHVRAAERKLGRTCRVLMDLGGPRARTGAVFARDGRRLIAGDLLLLRASEPDPGAMDHPFQVQCLPVESSRTSARARSFRFMKEAFAPASSRWWRQVSSCRSADPPEGAKLKPDKGLNFPGTVLGIPALTDKDRADLDVVIANADLIGYSFVQNESDIESLWN